ncbi:MAG: hypothetical protein KGL71_08405, partial [Xanthomonadaceae bacterium]|nr:hypothetical protein [Xanthomonadaceae bacterium]
MRRWLNRGLLALLLLVVAASITVYCLLRGSLPTLEGQHALPGLQATATVSRDANGTVTIDAQNESDALRALGYV